MVQFGDIGPYHTANQDVDTATTANILAMLSDPQQKGQLQLELAVTVHVGEPFVNATYRLEGDGPLALDYYEVIHMLQVSIWSNYHPNVNAVARQLSAGDPTTMQLLVNYALSCTQPGLQYFAVQLESSLSEPIAAFKAARLVNPQKVAEMMPTATDVDILQSFPLVMDLMLGHLKGELPDYVVLPSKMAAE